MLAIGPMVSAAPAPNPDAVMPAARPRRPGNHFSAFPTQVPYTQPVPMPPIAAATYNKGSELALELISQAMATRNEPPITTQRGPKRSTRYPSTGISQVSTRTNSVKATWIAGRPQWYFSSIGLTNSVQPYWRFATQAIQMTPRVNCSHGFPNAPRLPFEFAFMVRSPSFFAPAVLPLPGWYIIFFGFV